MVEHIKIPKRIGAVKVPKKLRKKANEAIRAAASPFVRDFARAAMAAAGRVRREAEDIRERIQEEAEELRDRLRDEAEDFRERARAWKECGMTDGEQVHLQGSKVAEAFREAAIAGIRAFMEGLDEGLCKAKAEAGTARDEPAPARATPKVRVKVKVAKPRKPRASRSSPGAAPA